MSIEIWIFDNLKVSEGKIINRLKEKPCVGNDDMERQLCASKAGQ